MDRLFEVLQNKFTLFLGWAASGVLVSDGVVKKVAKTTVEQGLTLEDYQILTGIVFTITMIVPRLYAGYLWFKKRLASKPDQCNTDNSDPKN